MAGTREQWRSHTGFVLAAIGSAVGLGNIWRFSSVAGENGGGAFLLVYLGCILLIGIPVVIAELALGRRGRGDALASFQQVAPRSLWTLPAWFGIAAAFLILGYYPVVAGWALKYFFGAASGALWPAAAAGAGTYFSDFIAHPLEPVGWLFAMLAVTMLVVAGGVQRGIEKANLTLMPLLCAIVLGLAAYSLSLPGSGEGWRFLLAPDWSALARPGIYVAALGQAFFSIGVGMAIFITYGSYMIRRFPIPSSAAVIVAGDTLFAIVAGLAIFPAVFAFGLDPAAGPRLAFITLPQIFLAMPGGAVVGTVFFLLLVAAAFTSMISLMEVPVAVLMHRRGFRRGTAVCAVGCAAFAIGIPAALSFGVLADIQILGLSVFDAMDQGVSNYLLPLGGILIALFVGWRWGREAALAESDFGASRLGVAWLWLVRIVVPAMILIVFLRAVFAG